MIIKLILGCLGLGLTIGGIAFLRKTLRLKKYGIKTSATVIDFEEVAASEGVSYFPVVKFRNQEDRWITETIKSGKASRKLQDKNVELYYNPENVSDAMISLVTNYLMPIIFMLIGFSALVLLVLGFTGTIE